jgi:ribonuclease Z
VTNARVLVTECTFLEAGHRDRARIGKHLHLSDIVKLLPNLEAEAVVITHLSRRTHLGQAKEQLQKAIPPEHLDRVFLLMDHRTNRARYERQLEAAKATQEA